MKMSPYLMYNGNAEAAFALYKQVLGGEIGVTVRNSDLPEADRMPNMPENSIVHTRIEVKGVVIMGSDSPPERYTPASGFYISLIVESEAEAERIFTAFAEGGQIHMPLGKTFWSAMFGMVVDRFGTPWMINGGETM